MKSGFFSYVIALTVILFTACNNSSETAKTDSGITTTDSAATAASTTTDDSDLTQETPSFTNVNEKAAASLNEVVTHYLHIKNALADDNGAEAANGAKAMVASLGKIDHASLAEDQMKLYMDVSESLKEHAEHTAENANKIDHQREHFVMMSGDVYDLVKGFGAGQTLYVDHCPMANDNKGANWISEQKEIKSNPYMGKKMPTCGKVEKVIKK